MPARRAAWSAAAAPAVAPEGHRPRPRRSSRSPLWTGGGTVFGPSPRHYVVKVNARRAVPRCAPSSRCTPNAARAVRARRRRFDAPSTKQAVGLLGDRRGGATLVVLSEEEARAAKSFRNLANVVVLNAENAGVADLVRAATLVASQAAIDALTARADASRTDRPRRRRLMDPSQVIIRPVVSEKSYVLATADKYTFRVHKDAHKTQIKQAVEELFDVKVLEVRTLVGEVQAQAPRLHVRAHARGGKKAYCAGLARATRSRSSRAWRLISNADPQAQAHLAGPALRDLRGLRGDHEEGAGEVPSP